MTPLKSFVRFAAIILLGFSTAFTVGHFVLGYRPGAAVSIIGAAAPSLDAETFNQIFSSVIAIGLAIFVRWYRSAGETQQHEIQAALRLADTAYEAVLRGLKEAGVYEPTLPPSPLSPIPTPGPRANELDDRLSRLESLVADLQSKLTTTTSSNHESQSNSNHQI
jgi:hypothetical protein